MRPFRASLLALALAGAALSAIDPPPAHAQWGPARERLPWIDSVWPPRVAPGDRLTIRGGGFVPDAQVFVGSQPASIEQVHRDLIVVVVPWGARDGRVVVRQRGADVLAGAVAVDEHAVGSAIARVDVEPRADGVRIVIRGRGFWPGDQIDVGGIPARVERVEDDLVVAWAPPGARGEIAWRSIRDGRTYDTGAWLDPTRGHVSWTPGYGEGPPWDDGYAPPPPRRHRGAARRPAPPPPPPMSELDRRAYTRDPYAPPPRWAPLRVGPIHVEGRRAGQVLVVVEGAGFGPDAQVWLGGAPVPVVSRADRELVVAVPPDFFGTYSLTVESGGQRVIAATGVVIPR